MVFSGEIYEKYCCIGVGHYLKYKNIGLGVFCQLGLTSKKGLNATVRKKCKKLSNIKNKISSLISLTRYFTKFIFLEQLTAMPQFNMQNMAVFFFSFSKQSS